MGKVIKSKKGIVLLAALVVAIAAAVGAYAYFTNSGSGTGTATVGTSVAASISGTSSDLLYPGGPGVPVSITVTNNGAGNQHIDTVTLDSIDPDGTHATCATVLGTDFSMANVLIDEDLDAGQTSAVHTGTLYMLDSGVSQDACKNAGLTLNLSSN